MELSPEEIKKLKANERAKEHYRNNREKKLLYANEYNERNKEEIKLKDKERSIIYRENNKEKIINKQKLYRENNKEKIKASNKLYIDNNKEKVRNTKKNYKNKQFKLNPFYKLKHNIANLIRHSLRQKTYQKKSKTIDMLGCDFDFFRLEIESRFESWMSWENYGLYNGTLNYGWDMDHIIPISTAKTEEDVIRLNHYTNFQPLCSYTNRHIKRDAIK